MTIGTGIVTSPDDARDRLIRSCSFSLQYYHPDQVIYFCSEESKEIIPFIEAAVQDRSEKQIQSSLCLIADPTDFTQCFELIYGVAHLYSDEEIVIESSSGTREMIRAAEIVSFLTRNPVSHVTGHKTDGMILPGTERVKEMVLYAAYDRLQLHRAIEAFNQNHFGSSIQLIEGARSLPERDDYYGLFNAYYYWDKLNYKEAYRYLEHAPDIHLLIPENREFMRKLLDMDERDDNLLNRKERLKVRQQKYIYVLIDLLHNAKRRVDSERYDDGLARLYRVVELISQVLLLSYGIDDNEEKIKFYDIKKLLKKQDISSYARKSDRQGIVRIGLRYKFMLLEDLGMKGAAGWYNKIQQYIMVRNDSILAHGLTPVSGELALDMWNDVRNIIKEACTGLNQDLEELYNSSEFPVL